MKTDHRKGKQSDEIILPFDMGSFVRQDMGKILGCIFDGKNDPWLEDPVDRGGSDPVGKIQVFLPMARVLHLSLRHRINDHQSEDRRHSNGKPDNRGGLEELFQKIHLIGDGKIALCAHEDIYHGQWRKLSDLIDGNRFGGELREKRHDAVPARDPHGNTHSDQGDQPKPKK